VHGEKLRGRFVLIRTRTGRNGKHEWLLLHKRDEYAVDGWDPEDHPRSVLSGRTNDDVRAGES
jgi:bifunctional non-homologous end joining protein LigD